MHNAEPDEQLCAVSCWLSGCLWHCCGTVLWHLLFACCEAECHPRPAAIQTGRATLVRFEFDFLLAVLPDQWGVLMGPAKAMFVVL